MKKPTLGSDAPRLEQRYGLTPGTLGEIQLTLAEIEVIIAALEARPQASFLVFGCGHDSVLWEAANREGLTVFLENNPFWAAEAERSLCVSRVNVIHYTTVLSDWQSLLSPAMRPELRLDLPDEVRSRRWDVILVDGPQGYDDRMPGRMQSIFAAAQLVAKGGMVFVHDCERKAERAFAVSCLGDHRLVQQVWGRALLNAYAF